MIQDRFKAFDELKNFIFLCDLNKRLVRVALQCCRPISRQTLILLIQLVVLNDYLAGPFVAFVGTHICGLEQAAEAVDYLVDMSNELV